MYAFLSYQTNDKSIAARVRSILEDLGISSFLAHEDIAVSEQWRLAILAEIGKADLFVAILSKSYYESFWCIQESGIAAFRKRMLIVPLSIDGAVPLGFFGHIQSTKIDPESPRVTDIFPALAKRDVGFVIDKIIDIIGTSGSYRRAEANFELLFPYLTKVNDQQIVRLLQKAAANAQISNAGLCAQKYLPPLMKSHGALLDKNTRQNLEETLARYA
jgi:hypothetical protein